MSDLTSYADCSLAIVNALRMDGSDEPVTREFLNWKARVWVRGLSTFSMTFLQNAKNSETEV